MGRMKQSQVVVSLVLVPVFAYSGWMAWSRPVVVEHQPYHMMSQLVQPMSVTPTGAVKEFHLDVQLIEHEILPGVTTPIWAFNGQFPGPEIRVTQGDLVRIHFTNTHTEPHTIHFHGINYVAQEHDGVQETSHAVMPGGTHTYEFLAVNAGTHVYHCHFQTFLHLDMGMYGAIIVEPQKPDTGWNHEVVWFLDEIDTRNPRTAASAVLRQEQRNPNYFMINGKAFPAVEPITAAPGEKVRIRMINMGYQPYSMHLHSNRFLVFATDGYDLVSPYWKDTLLVGPGERYDVGLEMIEGIFPFHAHNLHQTTNDGVYLGGATALLIGERANAGGQPASGGHVGHGGHGVPAAPPAPPTEVLSGDVVVEMKNFRFEPGHIAVTRGTTVTFVNRDETPHDVVNLTVDNVNTASPAFKSPMMTLGETWTHTFDEVGTHPILCTVGGHYILGMVGHVTVVDP